MAIVRPFQCIRPDAEIADRVAALPYDVYNREEAKQETRREPLSFLKIDRAETQLGDEVDTYDPMVYTKAKEILQDMIRHGEMICDSEESYYIYELIMNGRSQTGIAACASIDDYLNNVIKKHENTREEKELDRIRHVDVLNAQTGPIFLAYRSKQEINRIVDEKKKSVPLYQFTAVDGVSHNIWRIADKEQCRLICEAFCEVESIYIADGHHRAASAVKVGLKRRQEHMAGGEAGEGNKEREFDFFLSVLFPHDQLMILPYNRAVKDLNGLSREEFLERIREHFEIEEAGQDAFEPRERNTFGMYLAGIWYRLAAREHLKQKKDPVKSLDVSLLQDYLLNPVLGIEDPRTDHRIDFIGGIRGLRELEKRVEDDMAVAFSMYPTSISELFEVSDAGLLMPPKSTWFEPKLRSGLFIHSLD